MGVGRNLYASVASFKRFFANDVATLDAGDQTEIVDVLETGSRRVDDICRREFFAQTATRVFDGSGCGELVIPDLLAATTIKLDEDGDRTFELTLAAATDYYLQRFGYRDEDALPATRIRLDNLNGQRASFYARPRLVQIVGRWGYVEDTEAVGIAAEALDASETGLDVADGTLYSVGDTLLIDSEQLYVSAVVTNTLTVIRGVNGTTAATHALSVAIARYIYIAETRKAALIIAGRLWKRRETAYANVIANPIVGSYEVYKQHDPDVVALLAPFVRADYLI